MEGVNGIDTVAGIRKMDNDVPIAFLTTSLDHALDGYRYHVDRYITKPLRTGDIAEAIHKARLNKENAPSVNIPFGGKSKRVPLSRVRYLESQADSVYVYLTGGAVERTMLKLKDLAVMLPQPPFFVCHKSYIVNLQFVEGVDKKEGIFEMKEGGVAYIRRESRSQAASVYRKYMFDLARGQNI
ncbi:two component transcriptional regulator, LytTR family [Ruminococcus sp. YE71]|nr:two component transcriptional regulator, LytTR family [Ruminococcus sp. YE78]SFW34683.1 two component transcriptional regulator, LytTR family [Ruminococcus sp. YE71]